jgi:hypothetical protein
MGGLSRERKAALIGGQSAERRKFKIYCRVFPDGGPGLLKRGGCGAKVPFVYESLDHEEVKVQEGQAGR